MGGVRDRLRVALVSDVKAPALWLTAGFALVSIGLGAGLAVFAGVGDVALAAGIVAALSSVVGSLVPPSWTRQVAVPAGLAVAVAPALALLGQGRPAAAGVIAAVVFAVGALAQEDVPTGRLVGALGSTAYVLAVGMALVRDVPLGDALLAGVLGLAAGAVSATAARAVRGWLARRRGVALPDLPPPLEGRFVVRLAGSIRVALADWRHNLYVRLALRRVVVLAPLVTVLESWRDPVALYALIVAFSVTQPTASDTLNRALARTVGTLAAIAVTVLVAVSAPDWVVAVFAVLAMVVGLAYLQRSQFVMAVGTTVLTIATGVLAGTTTDASNRLLATVVGALVGLAATVVIPVPKSPPSTDEPA
jgi:uncharacterized membrane protein YccC